MQSRGGSTVSEREKRGGGGPECIADNLKLTCFFPSNSVLQQLPQYWPSLRLQQAYNVCHRAKSVVL